MFIVARRAAFCHCQRLSLCLEKYFSMHSGAAYWRLLK